MVARNVVVGGGEIDLVVRWVDGHAAVEVRTVGALTAGVDPLDRIDDAKLDRVRRLAGALGARYGPMRVDFVGVEVGPRGVAVRWVVDAA